MAKKNSGAELAAPYDDGKWMAEDDARTLMRANEIRADKKRLARAKAWAKTRADELKNITSISA